MENDYKIRALESEIRSLISKFGYTHDEVLRLRKDLANAQSQIFLLKFIYIMTFLVAAEIACFVALLQIPGKK